MYDTVDQSTNTSFVNFDAQQVIQPQLSHGEHIIWAGQPRQGIFLQPQDIFMIPFSFAWGGFAIFWMVAAWKGGAPLPFVMFGLPFVCIGLFMMFGRFFADSRSRAKTFYGVTDQRVLFVRNGGKVVTSLELKDIKDITFTQNNNGRGNILFGATPQAPQFAKTAIVLSRASNLVPMFNQIERVKEVYDQIRRAQENLHS